MSQTKKFSKLAYLEQSTSCTNKTRYISMVHKRTICGKRAGFPSFIKKNIFIEAIIFPQAQWKVRARGTDSDHIIWVNIQRRIEGKIWSAQLSYFNFITYSAKSFFILALCIMRIPINLTFMLVKVETWLKLAEPTLISVLIKGGSLLFQYPIL